MIHFLIRQNDMERIVVVPMLPDLRH